MLRQRVITALIMAATFLAAVLYLPLPGLAIAFGVVVVAGAWEWSRLAGWESPLARIVYAALVSAALLALYHYCQLDEEPRKSQVQPFLGVACLWWSIALLWVKSYPGSAVLWSNLAMRSLMGLFMLVPAWLAAVFLISFPRGGMLMVVMVIVVAAADVGAYFTGKTWGRHKLAPAVSPAKTWEGFWGGMASCLALAVVLWYWLPDYLGRLSLASVATIALTTAAASVVGDLAVSMVKRQGGFKDSGSLLPGHGGVLDRLDSLSAAAPVFALGLLLVDW